MSSLSIPDPINAVEQQGDDDEEAPLITESANFGTGSSTPVPQTPHNGLLEFPIGQLPLQVEAGANIERGGEQTPIPNGTGEMTPVPAGVGEIEIPLDRLVGVAQQVTGINIDNPEHK